MKPTADILFDLFELTSGAVHVFDPYGMDFESEDLDAVAKALDSVKEGYVDLVTSHGQAVGVHILGCGDAVKPKPSAIDEEGVFYLFNGPPRRGEKQGRHVIPLKRLQHGIERFYAEDKLVVTTAAAERDIVLMTGRRRDEGQGRWKEVKSTFGQFSGALLDHKVGAKDGPCFLQGQSANGHRKSAAQIANHIIGVDLDSGAPLEQVVDAILLEGLEAVIYTTHSHLKNTSVLKRDAFMKWSSGDDSIAAIQNYLVQEKGTLPEIVEDLVIIDDAKHTEEGIVILVQHKAMPKFRAVFPLDEPFVFAKRGGSQQDAILEWKERYAGFCTKLGIFYDEKCTDPARLFYLPRHAEGGKFNSLVIHGSAVDIESYDRVKITRRRKKGGPVNAFTALGGDDDGDDDRERYITNDGFNLRGWASKYASRFEVQTMLEEVIGGDFMRDERNSGKGGIHVECPFEAEHSSFGGQGTFVVNASDNYDDGRDGGFTFSCNHNACSGRDRLDYLCELIDQELITPDDLKNKDYLVEVESDEEEEEARPADRTSGTTANTGGNAAPTDRRTIAEIEAETDPDDEEAVLSLLNHMYAVIRTSGGVKILVEPVEADEDVAFESESSVSLFEKNRVLWVGGGRKGESAKKMEAFKLWLEWNKRRTYKRVVFAPGERVGKDTYNLFRGWGCDAIEGDWSLLRNHIYENICESDDELFNWFMTWLAMIIQQPAAKPGSTVVITGEKGTGKSTVFDYVNQLLGRCGITVSQRKQIVGQFNGHLATTLLMVCEEAFWAADPQAEGVLKDMITNKSVLIEKKGYDPIQSLNYTRMALISNNDWVVPASLKDERRFFVLRCSSAVRGNLDFFGAIRNQMEKEGGLEAMLYDLMNWKPVGGTFASLYNPPVTKYLQMQQIESLSGVQKFMLELVKSGIYETHEDKVEPIILNTDTETLVPAVTIRSAVEDYCKYRFQSDKAKTSYGDISAVVTDWFGAREVKLDVEGQQNKRRTFVFPPLAVTRAKLKESKGLDIEVMSEETIKAMKVRIT